MSDFLAALKIDEAAALVGHSDSGGPALEATVRFPHQIKNLVLVDSIGARLLKNVTFPCHCGTLNVSTLPNLFTPGRSQGKARPCLQYTLLMEGQNTKRGAGFCP